MFDLEPKQKDRMFKSLIALLFVVTVYFGVKTVSMISLKDNWGSKNQNLIAVTGHGEVSVKPDLATVSFAVEVSKDTQKMASEEVNTKVKKILDFLKQNGIEEKDIKTDDYSSYPKFSNPKVCPPVVYLNSDVALPPCQPGDAKIVGYTVRQNITVKIRKIDDTLSKVVEGINGFGVSNMNGPSLSIDKEDALKDQARKKAIDDARAKAKVLARDLGVRLGDIVSYGDNSNYYPMYYKTDMAVSGGANATTASAPNIPVGENTISSDVTISYEIR